MASIVTRKSRLASVIDLQHLGNTSALFYGLIMLISLFLCGCTASKIDDPLARFTDSIKAKDVDQIQQSLSAGTREKLSKNFEGGSSGVELFCTYLLHQCEGELPFMFDAEEHINGVRVIHFHGKTIQGTMHLVDENGKWKLDLSESADQWLEMKGWSSAVAELINSSLQGGLALPGKEFPKNPKDTIESGIVPEGTVPGFIDKLPAKQ